MLSDILGAETRTPKRMLAPMGGPVASAAHCDSQDPTSPPENNAMTTKTVTISSLVLEYDRLPLGDTAAGQSAAIERWAAVAGLVPAGPSTAQRVHGLVAAQVACTPDAHIHSDRDRLQERPDLAWAT